MALSILGQFSVDILEKIRRYDYLHIIPWMVHPWNFFAPAPIECDFVLLRRNVKMQNKTPIFDENWRIVNVCMEAHWINFFFNPNFRIRKAVLNLNKNITAMTQQHYPHEVICNSAYAKALFNYVTEAAENNADTSSTSQFQQFAIVAVYGGHKEAKGELIFRFDPIEIKHAPSNYY